MNCERTGYDAEDDDDDYGYGEADGDEDEKEDEDDAEDDASGNFGGAGIHRIFRGPSRDSGGAALQLCEVVTARSRAG